jgi:hypothetical protein
LFPTEPIVVDASLGTQYTFSSLVLSASYGFFVKASNAIGSSVASNTQFFVCANVPSPSTAPVNLEGASEDSITVSWQNPANDGDSPITGFKLFINALNDGDWQLAYDGTGFPTIRQHTVSGLKNGLQYRFRYTSSNQVGESAESPEVTLLCAKTPAAPGQPRYLSSTTESVQMEWTAPDFSGGALVESYNIYSKLANQAESDWVLVGNTDLNTLTFEHLIADNADSDIQYRVTAVTAAGEGAASIRATFTLASKPEVNAPVTLISQSKESLEL